MARVGLAAVDRHHVRRQRIEEQRDVGRIVGQRRDGEGVAGEGHQPDLPACALAQQRARSWRAPAAGATAAGRRRAWRWTDRARSPAALRSATAAARPAASSGRPARGSPAHNASMRRATAAPLRAIAAAASSRCGSRCGSTSVAPDAALALPRAPPPAPAAATRAAPTATAGAGSAGAAKHRQVVHAHPPARPCAARARAGQQPARQRPASSVRCAGARAWPGLPHRFDAVDFGIDAGQLLGVARAEELCRRSRCAIARSVASSISSPAARHRQAEAEHRQRAFAAEGDGVDAHAVVAGEFRGLARIEHAGGVDAVGQQDQDALLRRLRRAGASPRARSRRRSRSRCPARPTTLSPAARAPIRDRSVSGVSA